MVAEIFRERSDFTEFTDQIQVTFLVSFRFLCGQG